MSSFLLTDNISVAASMLRQGKIVAIPTESSYGLAVDAKDEEALRRVYQLKQRPDDKPLLVLVDSVESLKSSQLITGIPGQFKILMERFWPGALTLVFPAHPSVSPILTGGTATIAIRYSSHPIATEIARVFGGAITATSANISGMSPCNSASELIDMFAGGVDCIVGEKEIEMVPGLPSTLVGLKAGEIVILRDGQIPAEEIFSCLGGEEK